MHINKGDTVAILTGGEKDRTGKVLKVFPKEQRVIVEGINFVKKHFRARKVGESSNVIEKEATIHVSNVMLICPKCGKRTKVKRKKLEKGKEAVRYCRKCNQVMVRPH